MNISEKVFDKIKEEKVIPKPKWKFLLKDNFLYTIFGGLIIIGGLSFSVILYILFDRDWDLLSQGRFDLLDEIVFSLPVLWFVLLILFLGVAYYNFRHLKQGYKYKGYLIVLASVFGSLFLGGIFYQFKIGERFDYMLSNNFACFDYRMKYMKNVWGRPEKGMIAGKIIEIKNGKILILNSVSNKIWQVEYNDVVLDSRIELIPNFLIKVLGEDKGGMYFKAHKIKPFLKQPCQIPRCQMKERFESMRIR